MKLGIVVVAALVVAILIAALRPPPVLVIPSQVYHLSRKTPRIVETGLSIDRQGTSLREVSVSRPVSGNILATIIYDEFWEHGIQNFSMSGWHFGFIWYESKGQASSYSVVATKPGVQEWYYYVWIQTDGDTIDIRTTRPIAMRACADGKVEDRKWGCQDGSRSEPIIGR